MVDGAVDGAGDGGVSYFPAETQTGQQAVGKWRHEVGETEEGDAESTNSGREAREKMRMTGGVAKEGVVDTTVGTPEKV